MTKLIWKICMSVLWQNNYYQSLIKWKLPTRLPLRKKKKGEKKKKYVFHLITIAKCHNLKHRFNFRFSGITDQLTPISTSNKNINKTRGAPLQLSWLIFPKCLGQAKKQRKHCYRYLLSWEQNTIAKRNEANSDSSFRTISLKY